MSLKKGGGAPSPHISPLQAYEYENLDSAQPALSFRLYRPHQLPGFVKGVSTSLIV